MKCYLCTKPAFARSKKGALVCKRCAIQYKIATQIATFATEPGNEPDDVRSYYSVQPPPQWRGVLPGASP